MQTPSAILAQRISVPEHVLYREIQNEIVMLDLKQKLYYGLDEIGSRMWTTATSSATAGAAIDILAQEFEADRSEIASDLADLLNELLSKGLVLVQ